MDVLLNSVENIIFDNIIQESVILKIVDNDIVKEEK